MSKRHLYILALSLSLIGVGLFAYKALVLHFPLVAHSQTELWDVEVHLTFFGKNKPVKASLFVPRNTRRYAIVDENFISQGYGLTTVKDDQNRQATWSIRKANGKQNLYYRGTVRRVEIDSPPSDSSPPEVIPPPLEGAYFSGCSRSCGGHKRKIGGYPHFLCRTDVSNETSEK